MGCDLPTVKYSVFLFNTISAILGIGTIAVTSLALKNYHHVERSICIGIIVLGAVAFLISFFGCCGAIRENACLTWTYAICMLILIAGNCIVIFAYLSQMDGETKAREDIEKAWDLELKHKEGMSDIQTMLKCCGKANSTDYINANLTIPESCFVGGDHNKSTIVFSEGCLAKLIAAYEAAEHWVTIFIWSSCSFEIVACFSTCVLAITFANQKRRDRY